MYRIFRTHAVAPTAGRVLDCDRVLGPGEMALYADDGLVTHHLAAWVASDPPVGSFAVVSNGEIVVRVPAGSGPGDFWKPGPAT